MKPLVAYFSATGTTKKAAEKLAKATSADLYEIRPAIPYSKADLDWQDKNARSTIETQDETSRPALSDNEADIASHDVIFLGFPIWWYAAPKIINTFLENYDFSGKTIILFATSGGSRFGKTKDRLQKSAPNAKFVEGRILNGSLSSDDMAAWIKALDI